MQIPHRRLPHWQWYGATYFVTWRLAGSLPTIAVADMWTTAGAKFALGDRLLDAVATGPRWLQRPDVAEAVLNQLRQGEVDGWYQLRSWVLMPNHLHLILQPSGPLARVIAHVKACTARDANRLLHNRGKPFWARDYFDRWIRNRDEEERITRYIERNLVKATLCATPEEWLWSSASPGLVDVRR